LATLIAVAAMFAVSITSYRQRHENRIYTGITVSGLDLGRLTQVEAEQRLAATFSTLQDKPIVVSAPASGRRWSLTPQELGLSYDAAATARAAYGVGRDSGPVGRLWQIFAGWYYGRPLAPTIVLDEGQLAQTLQDLAADVNRPAVSARIDIDVDDGRANYTPGQIGRWLDVEDARERLLQAIFARRRVQMDLLVHDVAPAIYDRPAEVQRIQALLNGDPMTLYLQEPLAGDDLQRVTLPRKEIIRWLRVEVVARPDGTRRHRVFLDENAARQWLTPYARELFHKPARARFYFDDSTGQLVLVEPHVNGRQVDVEATLARLLEAAETPNRSVPFGVEEITPTVNSAATAQELGVTELISQRTTWFRGSSDARKHNIAQAASKFFGLVIAPGEEFSFNQYLGEVTEEDGYEEGLIIYGGQTIAGIGGGVCQVSTTVFQTVFYAGFPVTERWQHGYMLDYYNDGEGPGMDATVYSPLVDFRFINNTPYHLLIENYYNEAEESLTFKFYSTSMGHRVEKSGPVFEDVVPAPPPEEDAWTFDEDLAPGTVRQIDWATEGATVTVGRTVTNADGEVIIDEEFVSEYVPWPNGYQYGPGVEAPDYSLVP
jgi:vancomycin resistance protein YoaR